MSDAPDLTTAWTSLMSAWMARRQEALTTGLQALQKMTASPDPVAASRIYADWMNGSLSRIAADMADARRVAELGQKAGQIAATTVPAATFEPLRAAA